MAAETSTTDSSIVTNQSNDDLAEVSSKSIEERAGLSITANAMEGSDIIEITGQTSKTNEDVTFKVTAPNGNFIEAGQVSPNTNGEFATDISVGLPQYGINSNER